MATYAPLGGIPNVVQGQEQLNQNALAEYTRAAQEKQQTALLAQQTQGAQQENQIRAQQMKDQDALTRTITQYDPNKNSISDIPHMITSNGGSGQAAIQAQQGLIAQQKAYLGLTDEQFAQEQKKADLMQGVHDQVTQAAPADKQTVYSQGLATLQGQGVDVSKEPPQYPGDDIFAQHLQPIRLHTALLAEAQHDREVSAQEAKARFENAEAAHQEFINKLTANSKPGDFDKQVDAILPPNGAASGGQNMYTKAMVNGALSRGDLPGAQKIMDDAFQSVNTLNRDISEKTNPAIQAAELHLATAKKAAEQAITDGDPRAAAQLLVDGTVAPSQLVSSRKPAFAQQAFTAAAQMQPGWSATKADADYKVASSPANVAFFGSAKSLTDKGGTLDQLAAAGKDIPANQIPVFNTVADAIKASTGSGPIAKYAALALGVADDYSKVMGGGQGSDTSRTQAMNIIGAKQSPEQRAAAIEGIRGAVGSQAGSRVGNNPVLQKMYGSQLPTATNAPAAAPKTSGLQVGQTVKIKGKDMKVTAVHPDGSFDAQ